MYKHPVDSIYWHARCNLFAFSQFQMAWVLAYFYTIRAERFDETSAKILADTAETEENIEDGEGE